MEEHVLSSIGVFTICRHIGHVSSLLYSDGQSDKSGVGINTGGATLRMCCTALVGEMLGYLLVLAAFFGLPPRLIAVTCAHTKHAVSV